jgi:tRNA(Ile)-lysidine synthase
MLFVAPKKSPMHPLEASVERSILEHKLFTDGGSILVAVSGGLDSMVLLNLLVRIAPKHDLTLFIAHFNHQLRGEESDADESFVLKTAKRLRIPCKVGTADVAGIAKTEGISIEMAARRTRHEFFAGAAHHFVTPNVALAHHGSDRVELFFLRLMRGTGAVGLSGMKWRSRSPVDQSVTLVRPLLDLTRSDLESFAISQNIQYREDASNQSLDIPRNRIRHELIPLIKSNYQPAIETIVRRGIDILEAESDLLHGLASDWLSEEQGRHDFSAIPLAIKRRVAEIQLHRLGIHSDFELIQGLIENPGKIVQIGPNVSILLDASGKIIIQKEDNLVTDVRVWKAFLGKTSGKIEAGNLIIDWSRSKTPSGTPFAAQKRVNCETFDAESVGKRILLRFWQSGDRFQPIGMSQSVKLQDFFTNHKIPQKNRHRLLVGVAECGEIFWIQGMRIGEKFKLTRGSKYGLNWSWKGL